MPVYNLKGEIYDIPDDVVEQFEKDNPDAARCVTYSVGGDEYDIPESEKAGFLEAYPDAKPSVIEEPGEEKQAAEAATQATAKAETPAPSPETVPGSDEWRALGVASPGNPYNGKTYGSVYDSIIQDYGKNLAHPDVDPYAEARAQIMQAGITDDLNPDEADRLALNIREGYANRYAQNGAREMVSALPDQVPDIDSQMDSLWYSRDLQGRIDHEARRLGLRRDSYVNQYVKPQLAKALSDRYGYDVESARHIASRLMSQEGHTMERVRQNEAEAMTGKYIAPYIQEYFDKAMQTADEKYSAETSGAGAFTPSGLPNGQMVVADLRRYQATDPAKIWEEMKPSVDQMAQSIVSSPEFFTEAMDHADEEGIDTAQWIESRITPVIIPQIRLQFEQMAMEREMPKNTMEYIWANIEQSLVGTIARTALESQARRRMKAEALQRTEAGQGTYQPGLAARIGGGAAAMLPDMVLPFGGPFGIIAKIATKPVRGMAQTLITDGMRPILARMAESSLSGSLSLGAFEGIKGGVEGGLNPTGQDSYLEDNRTAGEILSDIVQGSLERGIPSAVSGAAMVGGPVGQKTSSGRGTLANVLGWGTQVGIDAAGATALNTIPKIVTGDMTLEDVGKEFASNVGTFAALGLHGKAREFANLADGGRSWNGVEFTKKDIETLEDRYLQPLRKQIKEIESAQNRLGHIERATLGIDATDIQREAVNSIGAMMYNDLMHSYAVPRDLKVKVSQALGVPIPEYALKPDVLQLSKSVEDKAIDLGWVDAMDYDYNKPGGVAEKVMNGEPLSNHDLTLRLLFQDNAAYNEALKKQQAGEPLTEQELELIDTNNNRLIQMRREYEKSERGRMAEEFERLHSLEPGTLSRMMQDLAEGKGVDSNLLNEYEDMLRDYDTQLDALRVARDEAEAVAQNETPSVASGQQTADTGTGEEVFVPESEVQGTGQAAEAPAQPKINRQTGTVMEVQLVDGRKAYIVDTDEVGMMSLVDDLGRPVKMADSKGYTIDRIPDVFLQKDEKGQTIIKETKPEENSNNNTGNIPSDGIIPESKENTSEQQNKETASAKYRIPLNEKAEPDYERAKAVDTFDALVEDFGEDYAIALVKSEIADAKKRIPKPMALEAPSIPNGLSMSEKTRLLRQQLDRQKALQENQRKDAEREQTKIDYWTSVLEVPKARKAEADRIQAEEAERKAEAERREKMQTPEGRLELLGQARNTQERAAIAKEIYGDYFNENTAEPDTVEELVSLLLPYGKLNWEGYDRGIYHVRGLQEELGSQHTRGWSKDRGTSGFNSYLAKKGEGESLDTVVDGMYRDDANLVGDNHRFTTEEIRDAVLDMLLSAEKPSDIRNYTLNSRIDVAEKTLKAEIERMNEEIENERETEAGQALDSQHPGGEAGRDREAGQGEIQAQGAGEETGVHQEEQAASGSENGAGVPPVSDTDVAGETPGIGNNGEADLPFGRQPEDEAPFHMVGPEGLRPQTEVDKAIRDVLAENIRKSGAEGIEVIEDIAEAEKLSNRPETKPFRTKDGEAYGFTLNGKIYIDPRIATSETPIHEYGHLWAAMKRRTAPEEWDQIKSVLMTDKLVQPFVDKVKEEYPELAGKEDDFIEEVLTQFSGKHGSERLRQIAAEIQQEMGGDAAAKSIAEAAVRKIKSILDQFWRGIADMMGWKYTSAEDIADRMLHDLLSGKNPNEEIAKAKEAKDAEAVRPQKNDKTLMGVHNISEEKLKKAIKQGGLANPSLAVVNTDKGIHTDYGDISLIPRSTLIDAMTGRNAGTYAGDAWSPTYPSVSRVLTKQGDKHRMAIAKEFSGGDSETERHLGGVIYDYIEGNGDRMHWLFLKQKGMDPEIKPERTSHTHEEFEEIQKIFGEGTSTLPSLGRTKEQDKALLDLMTRDYEKDIRENAKHIKDEAKREAYIKTALEHKLNSLLDKDGNLYFAPADTYVYENWRDEKKRKEPKPDWYMTDNEASYRVAKEGLAEEYEQWKEQLFDDGDIKEQLFAGWTPDGNKRYVANTVENASRLMNKEKDTNAYDQHGLNATRSSLLKRMKSLSDIRKSKHLLQGKEAYDSTQKEMSDELFDIISQISDMQKISDNRYMNIDYAEARLQEAITKRDPIGHLNKEYGYDIARDSELASQIMNFIEKARNLPVKYFETKFKRPVGLEEFAVAVVPEKTSPEVIEALKKAGLDVRTYDNTGTEEQKNANRTAATMDAVTGRDDIRFQKRTDEANRHYEEGTDVEYVNDKGERRKMRIHMPVEEIEKIVPLKIAAHTLSRADQKSVYQSFKPETNDQTGETVEFYNSAFNKNHRDGGLFEKIVPQIRELFKSSRLAYSEPENLGGTARPDGTVHKEHRDVKGYGNYLNKATIDGKDYYVRFTVQRKKGESGLHSSFVSNVKVYENPAEVAYDPSHGGGRLDFDRISDAKLRIYFDKSKEFAEKKSELGKTSSPEQIKEEELSVNVNPTEGQKEAGNYKKGHISLDGYNITIENPKGSVRSGVDGNGKAWSQEMHNTYGYIRGTEGVDGDHIDVFLSENPTEGKVYVIDQADPKTGEFDEHKIMYGFGSEEEARQAYLSNYEEGWKGLGNITEVSKEDFKKWVESSHRKTKPFADYKIAKKQSDDNQESASDGIKFQRVSNPEPEMTPEERQYWNKWDADMRKWREQNAIPEDAQEPGDDPKRQEGEDMVDWVVRVARHRMDKAIWKTAPRLEDYRQMRTDKDTLEAARENEQRYPDSPSARMRRIAAEFQQIRSAMGRQKAYDKATVKAVTDFAQDYMRMGFGDNLSRGEIERMLSSVKNATGAKDIRKEVDNILNILTDNYLRNLDQRVQKLSSTRELGKTAQGVEKQGKLELKGQRMIQAFRQARQERMTPEKIRERMQEVSEYMARDEEEAPMWEQEYEGLSIALQYAEDIDGSREEWADLNREYNDAVRTYRTSGRSYKEQQEYLDSLDKAMMENKLERIGLFGEIIGRLEGNIAESMEGAREFVEREKQRVANIQRIANYDLAGKDMGAMRERSKGKPANFFLQPLGTFEQMLRQFGSRNANGEGYLYNHFMRSWMDATDRAFTNEQKAKEELDEKAREVFGDRIRRWSDLYRLTRDEDEFPGLDVEIIDQNEPKTFHLNQGNLLYIYMADKMNDGAMKLRKMGITEEDVQAIKEHLDPRLVQLGDWLQDDYLVRKRTEYNKVHERMFGAPMAAIDHYYPIRILGDARVQEQDVNVPDSETLPSTITGNIIKRRRNALPLDILHTDALSLAVEHIEDMERWAATAEWNKDVNTLLSYTTFRNKVKNMKTIYGSGDALWNAFKDAAKMAAGTYDPSAKSGHIDKAISNIAKGVTAAKINFRVYTALKQLLSAPAFLHDVNIADFVKNSVNPYGSWKWAMENMPVFKKRWKSRQAGDTRLMDDPTDWKLWKDNVVQMATRMGMSPNALVDAVTCAVGARSIYESRLKRYKEMGMDEAKAEKRALQDAEIGYNLTQQSSEGAFVSAIQKDRTVAANMLSVFRNSSMAYTRQWVDAARNLRHRMQPGYREDSIKFMTRQFEEQLGLDHDQAQEAAEKEYARAGRHDVARLLNMMFGVTTAWNLGASLPYLLIGDDDDTKKEMMEDALLKGMLAGPTEGMAAGNLISELVGRSFASEATRKAFKEEGLGSAVDTAIEQAGDYEINPLPLMADIQGMIKKMGYDKYAAAQDVFNIAMQSAVGVNPQTFTDIWNAAMDYGNPSWMPFTDDKTGNDDLSNAKEIALFIMRVMNAPTSSWRNKYIDELGMGAEEAQRLSYDEMARRYANYKHWKDAPFMGWLRGDETRQKKMESIVKQFDKAVQERIGRLNDEDLGKTFDKTDDPSLRKMLSKEASKRTGGEDILGRTTSKKDQTMKAVDIYASQRTWQDLADDMELTKAQRNIKAGYNARKEEADRQSVKDGFDFYKDPENKKTKELLDDIEKAVKDIKKVRDDLGKEGDDNARWADIRSRRQDILERIRAATQD